MINISSYKTNQPKAQISKKEYSLNDFLSKEITFKKQFSNKKKLIFFQDLYTLISAGLDIRASLELVKSSYKKKKDVKTIETIIKELIEGQTFSDALKNSDSFSPYEYYSVKIGEETGRIKEVLNELAGFFHNRIEQNRKIISAFSYPTIVVLTALGAIIFMMNFVVPMFDDIYSRYDRPLPGITKSIINISHHFSELAIILLFFIIIAILASIFLKRNPTYQNIRTKFILKIPVFGDLIQKIYLARFSLFMELLIGAKTPLITAIQHLANMIKFYPIQSSLKIIENDILHGSTLSESMKNFTIYDNRMLALIKVGEEVNRLDEIFTFLKEQYNSDINHKTSLISSIMEPLLIVFIGVIVGVILISMYLPMFQISTSFSF